MHILCRGRRGVGASGPELSEDGVVTSTASDDHLPKYHASSGA